jgi:hypothetical protein
MNLKAKITYLSIGTLFLAVASLGCSSSAAESPEAQSAKKSSGTLVFTAADVEALEKGLTRETTLLRIARGRGNNAQTPEERRKAAQDEWEDLTIPGGAQAAGLSVARYRDVRSAVNRVLETLDFQGKIDGPLEIDIEHADPKMKQRLSVDPFAELPPTSASALHSRMSTLVPAWVHYMQVTGLNG